MAEERSHSFRSFHLCFPRIRTHWLDRDGACVGVDERDGKVLMCSLTKFWVKSPQWVMDNPSTGLPFCRRIYFWPDFGWAISCRGVWLKTGNGTAHMACALCACVCVCPLRVCARLSGLGLKLWFLSRLNLSAEAMALHCGTNAFENTL